MKSSAPAFMYPYWGRFFGLLLILIGILIFFTRVFKYDIADVTGLSFPVAIGLMMVFFSKEKDFDERIAYLKFKSLTAAVPLAAIATMLINYIRNFNGYSIETDSWFSISAFEYLSMALLFAIGWFHYLKIRE